MWWTIPTAYLTAPPLAVAVLAVLIRRADRRTRGPWNRP